MKNSILLIILLVAFPSVVFCQRDTTIYYDSDENYTSMDKAVKCIKVLKQENGDFKILNFKKKRKKWRRTKEEELLCTQGDSVVMMYSVKKVGLEPLRRYSKKENGYVMREYYRKGGLKVEAFTKNVIPLSLEGMMICYWDSGRVHSFREYKDNKMVDSRIRKRDGSEMFKYINGNVDSHARYPGGEVKLNEEIQKNIKYPMIAQENGITGDVTIRFVVDEKGVISNIETFKCRYPELCNACIDAFKGIKGIWIPALKNGKKVKDVIVTEIKFSLN